MDTSGPAISAIDHINIDTVKPEETIDFYEKVFGLENRPEDRPASSLPGAWLFSGRRAVVHLNFHDEDSETGQRLVSGGRSGAFNHVAFVGSDFDRTCARLDALGVRYRTGDPRPRLRQIFLRDPNDIVIEVNIEVETV